MSTLKHEILKFHSFFVLFCQMQSAKFNLIKFLAQFYSFKILQNSVALKFCKILKILNSIARMRMRILKKARVESKQTMKKRIYLATLLTI